MFSPSGLGACGRCHTTWKYVGHHLTMYNANTGMFPLCEQCWSELTPQERLPYYEALWAEWMTFRKPEYPDEWHDVERAVLDGS